MCALTLHKPEVASVDGVNFGKDGDGGAVMHSVDERFQPALEPMTSTPTHNYYGMRETDSSGRCTKLIRAPACLVARSEYGNTPEESRPKTIQPVG